MTVNTLQAFFMWCTIINGALLIFSSLTCIFAMGFIYRVHSRWFPMPKETFSVVLYSFIGMFKIFVIVFNLVPWIALLIVG